MSNQYRIVDQDETIQKGDDWEIVRLGDWEPCLNTQWGARRSAYSDAVNFRRPFVQEPAIEALCGYRLLAKDEVLQQGDMYWCLDDQLWFTIADNGVGNYQSSCVTYQRKLWSEDKVEKAIEKACDVGTGEYLRTIVTPNRIMWTNNPNYDLDGQPRLEARKGWTAPAGHEPILLVDNDWDY